MSRVLAVVLCALGVPAWAGSAVVIGGRTWTFPSGPVAATETPLAAPNGLAIGADGTLYIADQTAAVVVAIRNGLTTRIAGNGISGYSGDGGRATEASLNGPGPLAIARDGTLYIADLWNYVIRKVAPDGTISTVAGNGTYGACADHAPATGPCVGNTGGLAVDSHGDLYFSDSLNSVYKLSGGLVTTFAGGASAAGPDRIFFPESLAFDARDNLYVLQQLDAGVKMVSPAGSMTSVVLAQAQPRGMTALTVSANGTLYAAYNGCHVLKAPAGQPATDLASTCFMADGFGIDQRAVAVDADNNVYVADDATQTVHRISAAGQVSNFAGNNEWYYSRDGAPADDIALGGAINDFAVMRSGDIAVASGGRIRRITAAGTVVTSVPFGHYDPAAVAVAPNGDVLFADTLNCAVRRMDAAGNVSLFAGRGDCIDDNDGGDPANAGLAYPRALAIDAAGNVFIATAGQIRRVDRDGYMTTIAGKNGTSFQDNVSALLTTMDPRSLAIDKSGYLLVGDILNRRIRRIDAAGIITTIAGNGNFNEGGDDGPALSHPVGQVWSMTVDSAGTIWFSDSKYLRRMGADHSLSTVNGSDWGCRSCLLNVSGVRASGSTIYVADWPVIRALDASGRSAQVHGGSVGDRANR